MAITKVYANFGATGIATPWGYNEHNSAVASGAAIFADMLDDTNTATGWTLDGGPSHGINNMVATASGGDAGTFIEAVLDNSARPANNGSADIEFGGLPSGASVALQVAGHAAGQSRNTDYRIYEDDGTTLIDGPDTYTTSGSTSTSNPPITMNFTVPTNGIFVLNWTKGGFNYGQLNGFILTLDDGGGGSSSSLLLANSNLGGF